MRSSLFFDDVAYFKPIFLPAQPSISKRLMPPITLASQHIESGGAVMQMPCRVSRGESDAYLRRRRRRST